VSLQAAASTYVSGRLARGEITSRTARQLEWRLRSLVTACPPGLAIGALDAGHIERWQESVGRQRPASRRAYLSTIRGFCAWAVAQGLVVVDPTTGAARVREPKRVPRALPDAAIKKLWLILPDVRAMLIVALMFHLGLRCCEVANLADDDYDPVAETVVVLGKNGDQRRLPVTIEVSELIGKWQAERLVAGPMLIGLTGNTISSYLSRWCDAAGIKRANYDGISAHALRHTFASNTLDRCHDVRTVQAALGHESLATTQRYLRDVTVEQMRMAMTSPNDSGPSTSASTATPTPS